MNNFILSSATSSLNFIPKESEFKFLIKLCFLFLSFVNRNISVRFPFLKSRLKEKLANSNIQSIDHFLIHNGKIHF